MTAPVETLALPTARGRFVALAAGERGRPAVLVLHGFPDAPTTLRPLLAALAARGLRAIAPWMRGYAPSPRGGPFDAETLADDAIACADVASPGAPVFLLGHDWGAVATYVACARHRARIAAAVTLAVPHPIAFLRGARAAQLARSWYMLFLQLPGAAAAARVADFALIDRLWRTWSPGYQLPDDERGALHATLAASWPAPAQYYRALAWPPHEAIARVQRSAAARIDVPLLYLHGADDGCVGVEVGRDAARYFAGAYRRDVIEGAGHFVTAERPDVVAARAAAWFTTHAAAVR